MSGPNHKFSSPKHIGHHLVDALDEINSANSKIEKIRNELSVSVNTIRSDLKTEIMDACNNDQISALHVECLFQLFRLEND